MNNNNQYIDLKYNRWQFIVGFEIPFLNDKLKYSPKLAIKIINELKVNVIEVNGQFNSVWHNESLSNQDRWKGWRAVFESTWLD